MKRVESISKAEDRGATLSVVGDDTPSGNQYDAFTTSVLFFVRNAIYVTL